MTEATWPVTCWCARGHFVVELSDPPKAVSCMPVGISENPLRKHGSDLTRLFRKGMYEPLWYTWNDVNTHAESDQTIRTGL